MLYCNWCERCSLNSEKNATKTTWKRYAASTKKLAPHRLNMELEFQSLFGLLGTAVFIG
jgi:hypothetical protein